MPRRRRGHRNGYHRQQDKIRDTAHIANHGAPAGAGAGVAAVAATVTSTATSTATASLIKPDCDASSDLMDQLPEELQMAVEDATSCPVCLDVFVNPVVHSCGHSLCRRCHEALTIDKVMRFQCPVCRAPLVAKPPLNFSLQALTEIMRASAMQQARKDLAKWRRTTNSRQQLKRSTHNHNAHHQWQRRAAAAAAAAQPAPLALEPPRGVVMQPPRLQPGYFHGPKVDSWRYVS